MLIQDRLKQVVTVRLRKDLHDDVPDPLAIIGVEPQHLLVESDCLVFIPGSPEEFCKCKQGPHVGARPDQRPEVPDLFFKDLLPECPFPGSHALPGILQRFSQAFSLLSGQNHPCVGTVLGYLKCAPGQHHPAAPGSLHCIVRDLLRLQKRSIRGGRRQTTFLQHLLEEGVRLLDRFKFPALYQRSRVDQRSLGRRPHRHTVQSLCSHGQSICSLIPDAG
ncbi:hypothetical protein DSECCO2_626160 [anaerobic digester metagenome]